MFDEAFVPAVAAISGSKSMADISSFKEGVLLGSAARDQCFCGSAVCRASDVLIAGGLQCRVGIFIDFICDARFGLSILFFMYLSGLRNIRFAEYQICMYFNVCLCMFSYFIHARVKVVCQFMF